MTVLILNLLRPPGNFLEAFLPRRQSNGRDGEEEGPDLPSARYLRQPVAVQDGPAHGLLLVDVGKVLQSDQIDVFVGPAPLLVLHESVGRKATPVRP